MELTGKAHSISQKVAVNDKLSKREIIVEVDGQYPQFILLQAVNDKCDLLDKVAIGQTVKASINIKGRLWTNPQGEEKCFNTLELWKVE